MSNFKGTKGEWEMSISKESNGFAYVNGGVITIYGELSEEAGTVSEETMANAKLIACAPEMLEMLGRVIKEHETDTKSWSTIIEIEQLIKKATEL